MNQKQAIKTLTRLANERKRAYASNMDWLPDQGTYVDIAQARYTIRKSKKPAKELLSKDAYALFENENY